jgi:predicted transcriptional regulator
MKAKSNGKAAEKMLTEAELELMQILWKQGESSVADVLGAIPETPKPAYTTVSTLLRILEQKGVVRTRKEGRGHLYIPILTREEYEAKAVRQVVNRVFEGTPVALVKQLLNTVDLDPQELDEIRALLDKGARK